MIPKYADLLPDKIPFEDLRDWGFTELKADEPIRGFELLIEGPIPDYVFPKTASYMHGDGHLGRLYFDYRKSFHSARLFRNVLNHEVPGKKNKAHEKPRRLALNKHYSAQLPLP
jgi:hypothetical protein